MAPALEVILRNTIRVPLVVARAVALVILRADILVVVADPLGLRASNLMNLTGGRHAVLVHQRQVLVACVNDLGGLVEMLRIMMQELHAQRGLSRVV